MLTTRLLHPQILRALAASGHGSKVLIAAANFPVSTTRGANAALVSLALAPGIVTCTQVLEAIVSVSVFEGAAVIRPPRGDVEREPEAWGEYHRVLSAAGQPLRLEPLDGERFMAEAADPAVALAVATGDERLYTSLLLTVGVVASR